jgi:hypothetical protein
VKEETPPDAFGANCARQCELILHTESCVKSKVWEDRTVDNIEELRLFGDMWKEDSDKQCGLNEQLHCQCGVDGMLG